MKLEKITRDATDLADAEIAKNNLNLKITDWGIRQAVINRKHGVSMKKAAREYVQNLIAHNKHVGNTLS